MEFIKRVETCTIQCIPAMGMIPQLQCMVCYCMYHPECVSATTAEALARRFTCKVCVEEYASNGSLDIYISFNVFHSCFIKLYIERDVKDSKWLSD